MEAEPYITAALQACHLESIRKIVNRMIHKLVAAAKSSTVRDPKYSAKILNGVLQQQSCLKILKHNGVNWTSIGCCNP
jgi:hypothetical protein